MIKNNGIKAFADKNYDYYELLQDFGILKRGAIFVHDCDDSMYGSIAKGCLKLCWTPDGNCYSGLCANTVFLHYSFTKDKTFFKRAFICISSKNKVMQKINDLEHEVKRLKKELV